jgi:cation diffusion facilitator CzcD-associated flavoprotein CzcO
MAGERICVVGAGTSGLAMCRELTLRGADFECFEKGSDVGGNWRIDNDNGAAAAYDSLRTNVSRRRMQYPSTPIPRSYGDFVAHHDMAQYLAGYADRHTLREHIRLGVEVACATPRDGGGWLVTTRSAGGGEATSEYAALVLATGKDAHPKVPAIPGRFEGRVLHSQNYRCPEPFAGERVLVIGASNSACDVASEVSGVAASTDMAVRRGTHVLPRHLLGRPVDALNGPLASRIPWRVQQWMFERMLRIGRGRYSRWGWPEPDHPVLSDTPAVSATILAAVKRGAVRLRPEPVAFDGRTVRFRDGEVAEYDSIVFATGYRLTFPFFDEQIAARLEIDGNTIPLYRHIVPPKVADLYFIGIVDPHAGHPPVVEAQAAWIADAVEGRLSIPAGTLDPPQRRVVQRFPKLRPNSLLIDRFGYPRLLNADRRRASTRPRTPVRRPPPRPPR